MKGNIQLRQTWTPIVQQTHLRDHGKGCGTGLLSDLNSGLISYIAQALHVRQEDKMECLVDVEALRSRQLRAHNPRAIGAIRVRYQAARCEVQQVQRRWSKNQAYARVCNGVCCKTALCYMARDMSVVGHLVHFCTSQ